MGNTELSCEDNKLDDNPLKAKCISLTYSQTSDKFKIILSINSLLNNITSDFKIELLQNITDERNNQLMYKDANQNYLFQLNLDQLTI